MKRFVFISLCFILGTRANAFSKPMTDSEINQALTIKLINPIIHGTEDASKKRIKSKQKKISLRFHDIQEDLTQGIHEEIMHELENKLPCPKELNQQQKNRIKKLLGKNTKQHPSLSPGKSYFSDSDSLPQETDTIGQETNENENEDDEEGNRAKTPPTPKTPPCNYESISKELSEAVKNGNTFMLENILSGKNERKIFQSLTNKKELLFQAAKDGYVTFIKKASIYFNSSLINSPNEEGKTPLLVAIESDKPHAAYVLFGEVETVNLAKQYQDKLFAAIKQDRYDIVLYFTNYLSEYMDEITTNTDKKGNQAIHLAASLGANQSLQKLIDHYYKPHNLPLNMKNSLGDTPLHLAARKEESSCVEILLRSGLASSFIHNNQDLTPWGEIKEKEKRNAEKIRKESKKNKIKWDEKELAASIKPKKGSEAFKVRHLLKLARKYGGDKIVLQEILRDPNRYKNDLGSSTSARTENVTLEECDRPDEIDELSEDSTYVMLSDSDEEAN